MSRLPQSRVVVVGDFNNMMDRADRICEGKGLTGLLEKGTPTHRQGGMLDQIYSNIQGIVVEIEDNPISDHKMLKANIRFRRNQKDVSL